MRMEDFRGSPYTKGCDVIFIGDEGDFKTARVTQVISLTGKLIINTFPLPVKVEPPKFIVLPHKTPRTLLREALDALLDHEHEQKYPELRHFVSQANKALEGTNLWVRFDEASRVILPVDFDADVPDYEGGRDFDIPNRCAIVSRNQTISIGGVARGVGIALKDGHYVLQYELDGGPEWTPEMRQDPAFIKKTIMWWYDRESEHEPRLP